MPARKLCKMCMNWQRSREDGIFYCHVTLNAYGPSKLCVNKNEFIMYPRWERRNLAGDAAAPIAKKIKKIIPPKIKKTVPVKPVDKKPKKVSIKKVRPVKKKRRKRKKKK